MAGLQLFILSLVSCLGHALTLSQPRVTNTTTNTTATLRARSAPPSRTSICGYSTGDPSKAWSAPDGYDCRVDTSHGLWGFCPTTVIAAPDCSLGGYCFDDTSCQTGCGRLRNNTRISTWTCTPEDPSSRYCSFAYLTFGVDQTYSYYHCGPDPGTAHFMAQPTAEIPATSTDSSSPSTLQGRPLSSVAAATSSSGVSPATSEATAKSNPTTAGDNTNAIIGGTIGGIALVCGCVVAVVYLRNVRAKKTPALPPSYTRGASREAGTASLRVKTGGWGPRELPGLEARI
ncbi:hypothetical protein VB005_06896 [Metarhizium brunneum]